MAKPNMIYRQVMTTEYEATENAKDINGEITGAWTARDLANKLAKESGHDVEIKKVDYRVRKYRMDMDTFLKHAEQITV